MPQLPGQIGPDGRVWLPGTDIPWSSPPLPLTGVSADATGYPHQEHLFYAVNSGRWWLVYLRSNSPATVQTAWSTDLLTWTDGDVILLTRTVSDGAGNIGRHLGVAYANIAATDVVHLATTQIVTTSDHRVMHLRATISGITWTVTNADAEINSSTAPTLTLPGGPGLAVASDGKPYQADMYQGAGSTGKGDMTVQNGSNADAGSSWTAGFGARILIASSGAQGSAHHLLPLASGAVLYVYPNGDSNAASDNVKWSKWNGTNWTAGGAPPDAASLYGADFTAFANDRDFGACVRTTSDVHLVLRRPEVGNALNHWRYNGTSWTQQSDLPTQATKATGGIFLASDGTDVWAFALDSAAGNAVRYIKWSSGAGTWGSWADVETSSQVRTALSGCRTAAAGVIGLAWTEDTGGGTFKVVTKPFTIPTAVIPTLVSQYAGRW